MQERKRAASTADIASIYTRSSSKLEQLKAMKSPEQLRREAVDLYSVKVRELNAHRLSKHRTSVTIR